MKKLLFALVAILWAGLASAQFADQRQYAGTTAGTANAQTLAIANYANNVGVVLRFIPSVANTGPTTLAVNAQGPKALYKRASSGPVPLTGGELVAGQVTEVVYDGGKFQMLSSSPVGPPIQASQPDTIEQFYNITTNGTSLLTVTNPTSGIGFVPTDVGKLITCTGIGPLEQQTYNGFISSYVDGGNVNLAPAPTLSMTNIIQRCSYGTDQYSNLQNTWTLGQTLGVGSVVPAGLYLSSAGGQTNILQGTISGTVLTVTAPAPNPIIVGQTLFGAGINNNTYITSLGTGTGGIGTYNLSVASSIGSPESINVLPGLVCLPPLDYLNTGSTHRPNPPLCRFESGATITYVGFVQLNNFISMGSLKSDYSGFIHDGIIEGGAINGGFAANNCLYVPFFLHLTVTNNTTQDCLQHGKYYGDLQAPTPSSGLNEYLTYHIRDYTAVPVSGVNNGSTITVTTAYPHGFITGRVINFPTVAPPTIAAGGSGYGNNFVGTLTWSGSGCPVNPILNATANSSGAIVSASLAAPANCTTWPSSTSANWTAGGGFLAGSGVEINVGMAMLGAQYWQIASTPTANSFTIIAPTNSDSTSWGSFVSATVVETMPSNAIEVPISAVTNANPAVLTVPAGFLFDQESVFIADLGMANGAGTANCIDGIFTVTQVSTTQYSVPVNSSGCGSYTSGGFIIPAPNWTGTTNANPIVEAWVYGDSSTDEQFSGSEVYGVRAGVVNNPIDSGYNAKVQFHAFDFPGNGELLTSYYGGGANSFMGLQTDCPARFSIWLTGPANTVSASGMNCFGFNILPDAMASNIRLDAAGVANVFGGYINGQNGSRIKQEVSSPNSLQGGSQVANYTQSGLSRAFVEYLTSSALAAVSTPNNTSLKAITPTAGQLVYRENFASVGDFGGATYQGNTSNCPQADDGAEVQPTGTGCWYIQAGGNPVDIRVWGAVPTTYPASGGTDNGPIVNKAFASGQPLTCGGAYDFKLTATLLYNSSLDGHAPGFCMFYVDAANAGGAGAMILREIAGVSNILIKNMVFDGNSANNTVNLNRLIFLEGGDNNVVDHSIFENSNANAITFDGTLTPTTNSGVQNSSFYNIGNLWNAGTGGVWSSTSGPLSQTAIAVTFVHGTPALNRGNFLKNNTFQQIGADAVNGQEQTSFTFSGNKCLLDLLGWRPSTSNPPGSYGINCVYFPDTGSSATSSSDILVSDNIVEGATAVGIGIAGDRVTVEGNHVWNTGGPCIGVFGAETIIHVNSIVSGNTCMDFNQSVNQPYPSNVLYDGSGITAFCVTCGGGGQSNSSIVDNVIGDDQGGSATGNVGIWANTSPLGGPVLSNISIYNNNISNMVTSAYGGKITGPTLPPSSAGSGGLYVCVDSNGNNYRKSACP